MKRRCLAYIKVVAHPLDRQRGVLLAGSMRFACALGRAGVGWKKKEGDGVTPHGIFALRRLHYRADRGRFTSTHLPRRRIGGQEWWCDQVLDFQYNRLVQHRAAPQGCQEQLMREDALYDLMVDIGYNDAPVVRGRGSGIFLHIARAGLLPTAGCVAVSRTDMARILAVIGAQTRIMIGDQAYKIRLS